MKHKILGVAALLCAMLFAACSDLLEDLTPKETSSVEVETMADTDLYVHILEISGDFTLESEQSGTELRFTALDTEPGANLVWKVYKGLEDTAYTQSGSDTSFGFDTGDLEPGKYTLFVTSGTRSATAVFTVNTTGTVPVTLKTGGAINSILMQLCSNEYGTSSACTKFARSETNKDEATLYLDTEGKYIPVWSVDTEVYYYVPDGYTPVMNEDSSKMFGYCYNLSSLDVGSFDTSKVTNMSSMFAYCSKLTNLNLSSFNTGSVTNMNGMFSGCEGLTSLDLSSFNTSKVTDMNSMFYCCSGLTSLDVGSFNTGSVTNMYIMFSCCSGLTNLNLSSFNTSKVTNMSYMFYSSPALTTIYATSNFVTTNVTSGDYCFGSCTNLKGGAGTTYDSSRISAAYARIDGGTADPGYFTLKPIGSKSKPDAVGDIVFSDGSATPYTADLTLTEEQKAAAIAVIFDADKKLGVGLVQGTNLAWAKNGTTGYGNIATLSATKTSGSRGAVDAEFSGAGANDGSESLTNFRTVVGVNSSGKLGSDDYPAWAWIEDYATNASLAETSYESGWYMPSIKELCDLYNAKDAVNDSIQKTDGTQMSTNWFWSSSQFASYGSIAWVVSFEDGDLSLSHLKYEGGAVCAVRAFN